ncbi:MAG: class I SAM-dependent methyltransferase [Chlamydiae bacterium]|nr:class I SAM-dependent methyltransferase [Chlamydiota bacterium]
MKLTKKDSCRISGSPLKSVFDLGELPISCFPLPSDPHPEKHPVVLALSEESGLVQLIHSVDPDEMYSQYWYMSGVNQSMKDALKSIVDQALSRSRTSINEGDIVVDIASNDGTLLSAYPTNLFRVGIDPAKNIKPRNCNLHINTYFSAGAYKEQLNHKKAKIVTSIAMFYDLENPIQFAKDVAEILEKEGLWIIELSYLPLMLERNSFDTICAEHLEYYSLTAIEYILDKAGMQAEDVELNEVNGGSFRLYIRHKGLVQESSALKNMRTTEKMALLEKSSDYYAFADRVQKHKEEMIRFLEEQKRLGKKVLGYGASTKGNTIMAYYGIGPDLVSYVCDRNPIKWGRQTVTRIPIISEDEARNMNPDYFLAFPYHFMSEFLVREKEFLARGGKFISPIPKLTIYS